MNFQTLAIHSGYAGDSHGRAATVPLYNTASFTYKSAAQLARVFQGKEPGYVYTRIANPTTTALELRLGALEDAVGAVATSSGMAAVAAAALALLGPGDHIAAAAGIFGGTVSLFDNTLARLGIKTSYFDAADAGQLETVLTGQTRLIFVESIGNPRMDVPDFENICLIARKINVPLVVDNTVTTPALFKPGLHGADLIVHSTSKFINGHGTAIGGALLDTGNYSWKTGIFPEIAEKAQQFGHMAFLAHLRNLTQRDLGSCPAPANSLAMLQGLQTLELRMQKHCENALDLARFLAKQPGVKKVSYPLLATSPFKDACRKYFNGKAGAILTFEMADRQRAWKCIDSLKIAKNLANIGDAQTLVIHPRSTIYSEFSQEKCDRMKVSDGMIRVSVGLEDFEDIKNDFEQAIENSLKTDK